MRLLVVEDDLAVRKGIVALLMRAGHDVIALDCLDPMIDEVDVDLLITDVVMPGRSGPEVAQRLRQKMPELPVLFVSGHDQHEGLMRGVGRNQKFLRKPFGSADLFASIEELAGEGPHPD